MTYEEMQDILQQMLVTQREIQTNQQEIQTNQQESQTNIGRIEAIVESNSRAIQANSETQSEAQTSTIRIERIEAIVESNSRAIQAISVNQQEMQTNTTRIEAIVESNSRAIQAMLDQSATDRLKREEEKAESERRTAEHQQRMARLEEISVGLVNMLGSLDEDRPTILKKLNAIDRKVDSILDRFQPNQG